ncbi:MAG TPA: DNA ligase D [Stellaceae bacterium]|nr:DNA ligase D [Xanthobacteraceae bacterium]HUK08753.1 DNA ligase D [Stellaceae bacterium]
MALKTYRAKRKFTVTPEPRGQIARGRGTGGNRFVIQKHAARRLHYDFRLELDGVMKSWAVTKGPSLVPGEKRLAIHVEDHPIEYNTFEGTIPKGEYGGGTVMIWDRGRWIARDEPHRAYAKGHLSFDLDGEKLRGGWHLVRMRGRPRDKKEAWLLIKANDEEARGAREPDILDEKPRSAVTNRTMDEIAQGKAFKKKSASRKGARVRTAADAVTRSAVWIPPPRNAVAKPASSRAAALPSFVEPCLATLTKSPPRSADWIHEIKFDGYRVQARFDHGRVRLKTRKGLDWTEKFQTIADALSRLPAKTALIDGEVVVEDSEGHSDFSALQVALKNRDLDRLVYCAFDLLHLDGVDLTRAPQIERKAALAELLKRSPPGDLIRYSEHFDDDGAVVFKHACRMRLEGIISKRRDLPYHSGRSENWLKTKCLASQEFVIAGYEPSEVRQRGLRSLVLGYYEDGALRYAGRVGTGFSHDLARALQKKLDALGTEKAPFGQVPARERGQKVRWATPKLVVEIDFRGWTHDAILRQASFKGLREDKPAREVVREKAVTDARAGNDDHAPTRRLSTSPQAPPSRGRNASNRVEVGHVRLTHPDRVYWADVNVTKQQLAEYYVAIWDWIKPHIVDRPLALLRCPEGTKGECFFQKHIAAGIRDMSLSLAVDAKEKDIIVVKDVDDVVSLVQSGVLEIHARGSTIKNLELCDRIVFDLDPGEDVAWTTLVAAAREVRERLTQLKLESFVKLSGGKGLHVVLPIRGADWDMVKTFTQAMAMAMAADEPKLYVARMTKSLRKGRIFIDYLRNSREATSVAAYSSRARDGAPVSAPVSWQELGRTESAAMYTVQNLVKRLGRLKDDPWAEIRQLKQNLPDLRKLTRS